MVGRITLSRMPYTHVKCLSSLSIKLCTSFGQFPREISDRLDQLKHWSQAHFHCLSISSQLGDRWMRTVCWAAAIHYTFGCCYRIHESAWNESTHNAQQWKKNKTTAQNIIICQNKWDTCEKSKVLPVRLGMFFKCLTREVLKRSERLRFRRDALGSPGARSDDLSAWQDGLVFVQFSLQLVDLFLLFNKTSLHILNSLLLYEQNLVKVSL